MFHVLFSAVLEIAFLSFLLKTFLSTSKQNGAFGFTLGCFPKCFGTLLSSPLVYNKPLD
jgi:hypothetical protein